MRVIILADKTLHGEHEKCYTAPTGAHVAVIMVRKQHGPRDIILKERRGTHKIIPDTHKSYDAQYPLKF